VTGPLLQRLDRFARNLIPFALSLLLVIVGTLPFQLPGYGLVAANLALMSVFYWSVYRPDLLPPWAAFLIGLLQDILVGTPPGLNALVLLLARAMVVSQGRVFRGKSFLVMWWGFAMVALGAQVLVWLLTTALQFALLDPMPAVFQGVLTVALFPFLTWFFARTQHAILQQG
jgi:rod shape-determining protein MreD